MKKKFVFVIIIGSLFLISCASKKNPDKNPEVLPSNEISESDEKLEIKANVTFGSETASQENQNADESVNENLSDESDVKKNKYTKEYLKVLLERIEELEKNPGEASFYELELLNQELDEILSNLM